MKKRLVVLFLSFIVIYIANFFIPRLMPGDPFRYTSAVSGEDMDMQYSNEQINKLKSYYNLDKPIGEQFIIYTKGVLKGDLGSSIFFKRPVKDVLANRFPWSLYIMLTSLIISLVAGTLLALGTVNKKKADDIIYPVLSTVCEVPSFIIAVLILFLIGANTHWLPLSSNVTPFVSHENELYWISDVFLHSIMPVLSMVLVTMPGFYFTARASFLTASGKPYINTATAKGLKRIRVNTKYILKNSMSAIVAKFFLSFATAVGATLLIENVFAYPGIGKALKDAVAYRDYPMIQGIFLLSSTICLICIFISDSIVKKVLRNG